MEKYCPKCFKKYPLTVEVCPADGSFLVSPHEKDLTGEVLDNRYTVLERIGRGGMGVVYKAEQHLIKRIVALKVLRREIVQDESAAKRFLSVASFADALVRPVEIQEASAETMSPSPLFMSDEHLRVRTELGHGVPLEPDCRMISGVRPHANVQAPALEAAGLRLQRYGAGCYAKPWR